MAGRRPVIFYPNSGETWDAAARSWLPGAHPADALAESVDAWLAAGVRAIGGCCRVTPQQIAAMRARLELTSPSRG